MASSLRRKKHTIPRSNFVSVRERESERERENSGEVNVGFFIFVRFQSLKF